MQGLIIINGYPNGEKFYRQAKRIADELKMLGVETDVLRNGEVSAMIHSTGDVSALLPKKYDFAVYLDKDKYLGKMLESTGLRLFNSATAVELCDDKLSTYLALQGAGLPLMDSIPAPLCYTPNAKPDETFVKRVADTLGFPLVMKTSYGSFGVGVQLVQGVDDLRKIEQENLYRPHFYQRFLAEASGRDIRVIVIGGKTVAGMERIAMKGEFRSNIELGGRGEKIDVPKEIASLAERVAQVLQLDYCGVDILQSSDGGVICEVNSNAFFEGLEKATGVNVARKYAEYIVGKVKNTKKP
jgi:ribosomal protein S6--L-glutamate ligase/gamma-F420-2:alpha-L-glutamate ligase